MGIDPGAGDKKSGPDLVFFKDIQYQIRGIAVAEHIEGQSEDGGIAVQPTDRLFISVGGGGDRDFREDPFIEKCCQKEGCADDTAGF